MKDTKKQFSSHTVLRIAHAMEVGANAVPVAHKLKFTLLLVMTDVVAESLQELLEYQNYARYRVKNAQGSKADRIGCSATHPLNRTRFFIGNVPACIEKVGPLNKSATWVFYFTT